MNVQVEYTPLSTNDTVDITNYVLSYFRDQKICSSIGTLQIDVVPEILDGLDLNPWDEVVLYEGGEKKGTYLIGDYGAQEPDGHYTLFCQDFSKKLQDYFIDQSYLIDYPSTTRYWIEQFLTAAQVEYVFDVEEDDYGSLLSNNTSVGLQSAYDQVMVLLQMSGWYMFFNKGGVAHIGKLNVDIYNVSYTLNKSDILDIKVNKHDKMLRNRAVVWGNTTQEGDWVYADISTTTPWNYDSGDIRSVVIANSNIESSYSAYIMAEQLMLEFARITVEKWITSDGPRDIELGDFIMVKSNVYRGVGLVTTIGSELSPGGGLRTIIIMDERCPRLFNFYNFGDYVYIGTDGSGVWRKLIDFGGWADFSTGLNELYITDLYKNDNILSTVTRSGEGYLNLGAEWFPITIGELTASGVSGETVTVSSGIRARAVAQDRNVNTIKLGVDTLSGVNFPYYEATEMNNYYTNIMPSFSGVYSWLLDVSELGNVAAQYQVSLSGNPYFLMLDVENDGLHDYVSVVTSGIAYDYFLNNDESFGDVSFLGGISGRSAYDEDAIVNFTETFYDSPNNLASLNLTAPSVALNRTFTIVDNDDDRYALLLSRGSGSTIILTIAKPVITFATNPPRPIFNTTNRSGLTLVDEGGGAKVIQLTKVNDNTYRIYYVSFYSSPTSTVLNIGDSNTLAEVYYKEVTVSPATDTDVNIGNITIDSISYDGTIVDFQHIKVDNLNHIFLTESEDNNTFELYNFTIDTSIDTVTGGKIFDAGGASYPSVGARYLEIGTFDIDEFRRRVPVFHNGQDDIQFSCLFKEVTSFSTPYVTGERVIVLQGNSTSYTETELVSSTFPATSDDPELLDRGEFFTGDSSYCMFVDVTTYEGTTYYVRLNRLGFEYSTSTPYSEHNYPTGVGVYPLFIRENECIVSQSSNLYISDKDTMEHDYQIVISGYTLNSVYSYVDQDNTVYFDVASGSTPYILGIDVADLVVDKVFETAGSAIASATSRPTKNGGNFFIRESSASAGQINLNLYYYATIDYLQYNTPIYYVMVRDENEFIPVISGYLPFRLDASNFPLLVAQDLTTTLQYVYSYPDELLISSAGVDTVSMIGDMREYAIDVSGVFNKYVIISSVNDLQRGTLPEPTSFNAFYTYSGGLKMIETSNYKLPGQYVFAASSGVPPAFVQKDPDTDIFIDYSVGLPGAAITMIRLDDRI